MTEQREVEAKYRVHALFRMPELRGVAPVAAVEEAGTATLTAVYHDTADLRLARNGITLRRREGGADAGWHLKLPVDGAGPGVRDEVTLPLSAGRAGSPPAALRDLVTAFARQGELLAVATLRTERTSRLLHDDEGRALAELTDDTVSVVDDGRVAVRFRELELEVRTARLDELSAVDDVLAAAGAVPGEFVSKAVRALGPRAQAGPDVTAPGTVTPDDPAAEAVRAHLARQLVALRRWDLAVRRDEPDAVHQMRVASRRLRSGLQAFQPLLDPGWERHVRDELRWVAGELGGVRDREVLLARLERDAGRLPDGVDTRALLAVIRRELGAGMLAAREEAESALRSERYVTLLDSLVEGVADLPLTELARRPGKQVLPPVVTHAWKRLAKDVRGLEPEGHDEQWHEARKAAKRLRYTCESLVPVFGSRAGSLAGEAERVTDVLGEHQDAAIAARTCAELAGVRRVAGPTGFALGLLHDVEREAVRAARSRFVDEVWPGVSRPKHRRWLR